MDIKGSDTPTLRYSAYRRKVMSQIKILAVMAAALCCAAAQAGDVYKYVDDRGNTMYTDKPIPGAVLVSSGNPRPPEVAQRAAAAAQSATNAQLTASNQRIAEAQNNTRIADTVARDLEASRQERCKKARDEYQKTIGHTRLYREKPDGQREFLTDAEIAQARVNKLKNVEAICGPQG
jgi:hypothetical protein